MAGLSNITIEKFIEEENGDFEGNFAGVFLLDHVTTYKNF